MLHLIKSNYCCCCCRSLRVTIVDSLAKSCDCSDHQSGLHLVPVDLLNSIDETCVPEREVLVHGNFPVFLDSGAHDFLKTRVDDVKFGSTLSFYLIFLEAHHLEELLLRFFLIFLGHTTGSDVIDIFKPFEIRAGDTTAVHEHVRSSDNTSAREDLLGGVGGGTVGSLENGLNLNQFSIAFV